MLRLNERLLDSDKVGVGNLAIRVRETNGTKIKGFEDKTREVEW